jgi:hypothetical protein
MASRAISQLSAPKRFERKALGEFPDKALSISMKICQYSSREIRPADCQLARALCRSVFAETGRSTSQRIRVMQQRVQLTIFGSADPATAQTCAAVATRSRAGAPVSAGVARPVQGRLVLSVNDQGKIARWRGLGERCQGRRLVLFAELCCRAVISRPTCCGG